MLYLFINFGIHEYVVFVEFKFARYVYGNNKYAGFFFILFYLLYIYGNLYDQNDCFLFQSYQGTFKRCS